MAASCTPLGAQSPPPEPYTQPEGSQTSYGHSSATSHFGDSVVEKDDYDFTDTNSFASYPTWESGDMPQAQSRTRIDALRKHNAWQRLIPQLLPIYRRLLRETANLRNPCPYGTRSMCDCPEPRRNITIELLSFDAAQQLVSQGYFPTAPILPSLAVHIRLLDFTSAHFVRASPGVTSWSDSLSAFLEDQGFTTDHDFRKRFGQAARFYFFLKDYHKADLISRRIKIQTHVREFSGGEWAAPELSTRCPICFGGSGTQDYNSRGTQSDIPLHHPSDIFLSPEYVGEIEQFVLRQRKGGTSKSTQTRLDSSILKTCVNGHTAGDETNIKASKKLKDDTGLMALVCRHDLPILLANMKSSGEKQFYAVALIKRIFELIPKSWTITLLYDIACVLEASAQNFDFLGTDFTRIRWGVSVFHAYSHIYPCQVLYHPRFVEGCALFDGEGCERLWNLLMLIIAINRVSGYYQRLYTINRRIQHITLKKYDDLGHFVRHKSEIVQRRLATCRVQLGQILSLGISIEDLRREWADEVQHTCRPKPSAKLEYKKQVDRIAALLTTQDDLRSSLDQLDTQINNGKNNRLTDFAAERKKTQTKYNDTLAQLRATEQLLGIRDCEKIRDLLSSEWARLSIKAGGLKDRLLDLLRERKRMNERSERGFAVASKAHSANDRKLEDHIASAIKKRAPQVKTVYKELNAVYDLMDAEFDAERAPSDAIRPRRISKDELYDLNIDSPIWDNSTLAVEYGDNLSAWAKDVNVRRGIRLMLLVDRCKEELERLKVDRDNLQMFAQQSWLALQWIHGNAVKEKDEDLAFCIGQEVDAWRQRILSWKKQTNSLASNSDPIDSWGPTILHDIPEENDGKAQLMDFQLCLDDDPLVYLLDGLES
ncbi:hypothetical protein DL96DRAFT_1561949 [Flagelloscypha sp. PMI_526]|nr:hypothetical protein DL96DRAFT_1566034 [Flagelloscypha sp. PMI_526]KAH8810296.1 hypothetical protein DL96DRAFT_1561949 [Flagelloscypha sp. PMI_526]